MWRAFLYQCKYGGFIQNFIKTRTGWQIFSRKSHQRNEYSVKITYNTKESADKAAFIMNVHNGKYTLETYKCGFCNGYHITNNK